jgi:site-specific recombinase XerD
MTTNAYYSSAKALGRLHEGPLGTHVDLYAARLLKDGYCQQSGWRCLHVIDDFSRWLARRNLGLRDIDEQTVERYQQFRVRYRCRYAGDRRALRRLLAILREVGVIVPRPPIVPTPHEQVAEDFQRYLSQERGLTRVTVIHHLPVIRRFLRETCAGGAHCLSRLTRADVTGFVERHARDRGPDTAKGMCWTLRAFLRYLQYRGQIAIDLAISVPSVRRWRFGSLPTYLSPAQVQKVLDACDRRTAMGLRDYAILIMLARLGLRANEIATLTLDDLDWRSGELTVRSKGGRRAQMPLPPDVGKAVAAYLRHGRPQSESRRLFLRCLAPRVGFASSAAVSMVAKLALKRGGIDGVAHKGAHLFRHSLATALLHAGASLTEIGQVLRHQDHDTTRIYAKVNIDALRPLGLPWPGGMR